MCGFLVTVSKKKAVNESIHRESLKLINHRGPDSTNVIKEKRFWLGFNRLSILDLDKRSSQPFFNFNERYILLFNGEIYNYRELKNFLEKNYGIAFRTESDTEILYYLILQEGIDAFKMLRGVLQ